MPYYRIAESVLLSMAWDQLGTFWVTFAIVSLCASTLSLLTGILFVVRHILRRTRRLAEPGPEPHMDRGRVAAMPSRLGQKPFTTGQYALLVGVVLFGGVALGVGQMTANAYASLVGLVLMLSSTAVAFALAYLKR